MAHNKDPGASTQLRLHLQCDFVRFLSHPRRLTSLSGEESAGGLCKLFPGSLPLLSLVLPVPSSEKAIGALGVRDGQSQRYIKNLIIIPKRLTLVWDEVQGPLRL